MRVAKVEGARPEVTAIHAGLECGIIGAKMPGIEMVREAGRGGALGRSISVGGGSRCARAGLQAAGC